MTEVVVEVLQAIANQDLLDVSGDSEEFEQFCHSLYNYLRRLTKSAPAMRVLLKKDEDFEAVVKFLDTEPLKGQQKMLTEVTQNVSPGGRCCQDVKNQSEGDVIDVDTGNREMDNVDSSAAITTTFVSVLVNKGDQDENNRILGNDLQDL